MSTAHRGITNHLLLESFERLHKSLLHMGYTDHESTRGAAALTFALSGEFTREQAWEAADAIAAQAQQANRGLVAQASRSRSGVPSNITNKRGQSPVD